MTALAIIFVFLGFGFSMGYGVLMAAGADSPGDYWLLIASFLVFLALFVRFGCLPPGQSSDHH